MNIQLITWGATLLGGLGIWLVLSRFFDGLIDLGAGLINYVRRFWEPTAVKWLKEGLDQDRAAKEISRKDVIFRLSESLLFWFVLAVTLAVISFDHLRAVAIFSIVFVFGEILIASNRSKRLARLNNDTENLITQFESRYPLKRSISGTLEDARETIKAGELRSALDQVCALIRLNRRLVDAMKPLLKYKNPTLRQFAISLSDAQETSPETLESIFTGLKNSVKSRSSLFGEIRQSLTILRITSRVLQAILAATLICSSMVANWRTYFLASNANWMLLIVMAALGIVSSFYVEMEIKQLEES